MSPICLLRAVWRTVRCGAQVSGHDYSEQPREAGQPKCVQILKCDACGKISVCWSACGRCGAKACA